MLVNGAWKNWSNHYISSVAGTCVQYCKFEFVWKSNCWLKFSAAIALGFILCWFLQRDLDFAPD